MSFIERWVKVLSLWWNNSRIAVKRREKCNATVAVILAWPILLYVAAWLLAGNCSEESISPPCPVCGALCGALCGAAGMQLSLGSEAGAFKWKLE